MTIPESAAATSHAMDLHIRRQRARGYHTDDPEEIPDCNEEDDDVAEVLPLVPGTAAAHVVAVPGRLGHTVGDAYDELWSSLAEPTTPRMAQEPRIRRTVDELLALAPAARTTGATRAREPQAPRIQHTIDELLGLAPATSDTGAPQLPVPPRHGLLSTVPDPATPSQSPQDEA
ncbi:hypothetical protein LTR53_017375, partial [Teratosphaeriaceae sp. CCFEE 6253]